MKYYHLEQWDQFKINKQKIRGRKEEKKNTLTRSKRKPSIIPKIEVLFPKYLKISHNKRMFTRNLFLNNYLVIENEKKRITCWNSSISDSSDSSIFD
jgi:hypothetical protein